MAPTQMGEAYALFRSEASLDEMSKILPYARDAVGTPENMKLDLNEIESLDTYHFDEGLRHYVTMAKEADINYSISARLPKAGNEETAREVSSVLGQMYQSELFSKDGDFRGEIAYKDVDTGRYVFLG